MTKTRNLLPALVFALGLLSGFGYLASGWFAPVGAFSEEERVAIHIAHGEGFLTPFLGGTNAPVSSWCPPIYPAVAGAIYYALGVRTHGAILAILLLNLTCRAVSGVAVFCLGRRIFGLAAGIFSAGVFLVSPLFLQTAMMCWDNSLALATFLWLIYACIVVAEKPARAADFVFLGLGMGLLLLTNAAYAAAPPVMLLLAWNRRYRRGIVISGCTMLLTLVPWTARNYAVFGRLIFTRGNLYTELWLANEPGASGWMTLAAMQDHPSESVDEQRELLELGETKYFALCRERFWAEYNADRGAFWRRTACRAAYVFIGEPSRGGALFNMIVATLGLAGLWAGWRMRAAVGAVALAGFASVVPYVPAQVHDRYVLPLRAVLALGCGIALAVIVRRLGARRKEKNHSTALPAARRRIQLPRMPSAESDNSWTSAPDNGRFATAAGPQRPAPRS
jgi:hypothetical protein